MLGEEIIVKVKYVVTIEDNNTLHWQFLPTFHKTGGGNGCSCLYYPDLLVENKGNVGGKICLYQFAV